jgi:hypothetical protein
MLSGKPHNKNLQPNIVWISNWLLVCLAASLAELTNVSVGLFPIKEILMCQAIIIFCLGFLFYPANYHRFAHLLWSFCLGAGMLITALLENASLMQAMNTAVAVFVLSVFLHSFCLALAFCHANHRLTAWVSFWTMLLFSTLPVWLSPWVEYLADTQTKINGLLWASPLSYLAGMLDYDYLRNQWFYTHTSYNMLRYDYPEPMAYSLSLIAASLILMAISTGTFSDTQKSFTTGE